MPWTGGEMVTVTRAPRIVPKRRRIDGRDPGLVFWIDTAGHGYYRVLLATEPGLFDPGAAANRTPATFFDSTEISGGSLFTASNGESQYAVPREVMRRMRPARTIHYALIAYDGPTATNGVMSMPVAAVQLLTTKR